MQLRLRKYFSVCDILQQTRLKSTPIDTQLHKCFQWTKLKTAVAQMIIVLRDFS